MTANPAVTAPRFPPSVMLFCAGAMNAQIVGARADPESRAAPVRDTFRIMVSRGLTLHAAMVEVLRAHAGSWMDEVAREIARLDLFRRPSDGRHPPSDQLRLRARKPEYQHVFECSDTSCSKIRLRPDAVGPADARQVPSPADSRRQTRRPSVAQPSSPADVEPASSWYEDLRYLYKPRGLRYLLIGESPPDPGRGDLRFFYSPTLKADNLYRGVAAAVYGHEKEFDVRHKPAVLARLCDDGFWLIDAVDSPVNKLANSARARAIKAAVPALVERCAALAPERGVIICHSKVYEAAADSLRAADILVLHDRPLPFPLGNWRGKFVDGFRKALGT